MSVTAHWLFPAVENDRSQFLYDYNVAFAGCNSIQQRLTRKKRIPLLYISLCKVSQWKPSACCPFTPRIFIKTSHWYYEFSKIIKNTACTLFGLRRENEAVVEKRAEND